jgi:hypothetical protein
VWEGRVFVNADPCGNGVTHTTYLNDNDSDCDNNNNNTVIPRLTSDPAKNFSANEDFSAVFWTRLTNMDPANECFSGCAR